MPISADDEDARPSKSALKREHKELQILAVQLAALPVSRFRALPLAERTREEIERLRVMEASGSRNRQTRLVAQLLVDEDLDALRAAPEDIARRHGAETARHHAAEQLRDALLKIGVAALDSRAASAADVARARRLLADAGTVSDGVRARTAHRELYRFARELLDRAI